MSANGLRITDLPVRAAIDALLGNSEGSTCQIDLSVLVSLISSRLGPNYETLVELQADLDWAAGSLGTVWGEADPQISGTYQKEGVAGAGQWTRIGALPIPPLTQAVLDTKADATALADLETTVAGVVAGLSAAGPWNPTTGQFPTGALDATFYVANAAGTVGGQTFAVGDWLIALVDNPSTSVFAGNWTRANYSEVVAASLLDQPFLAIGNLAATDQRLGTLHIAGNGTMGGGGTDYGIAIRSFEPGIKMIDRSAGSGQTLLRGNNGEFEILHDIVNNDGSIGVSTNLNTRRSAYFTPSIQRFYNDGTQKIVLDVNGLAVDGDLLASQNLVRSQKRVFKSAERLTVEFSGPTSDQFVILSNQLFKAGTHLLTAYGHAQFNSISSTSDAALDIRLQFASSGPGSINGTTKEGFTQFRQNGPAHIEEVFLYGLLELPADQDIDVSIRISHTQSADAFQLDDIVLVLEQNFDFVAL